MNAVGSTPAARARNTLRRPQQCGRPALICGRSGEPRETTAWTSIGTHTDRAGREHRTGHTRSSGSTGRWQTWRTRMGRTLIVEADGGIARQPRTCRPQRTACATPRREQVLGRARFATLGRRCRTTSPSTRARRRARRRAVRSTPCGARASRSAWNSSSPSSRCRGAGRSSTRTCGGSRPRRRRCRQGHLRVGAACRQLRGRRPREPGHGLARRTPADTSTRHTCDRPGQADTDSARGADRPERCARRRRRWPWFRHTHAPLGRPRPVRRRARPSSWSGTGQTPLTVAKAQLLFRPVAHGAGSGAGRPGG